MVNTRLLATASACSPALVESQVIPPPTPYPAAPVADSIVTVRIGTLKTALPPPGSIYPIAPQ